MKRWNQPPEVQKPIPMPEIRIELPALPSKLPDVGVWFECLACSGKATVLFEGSSYCRSCLKEKLRMGQ